MARSPKTTRTSPLRRAQEAARSRSFVGRRAELDQALAALAGTDGMRPILVVDGPGGVGKTTFLDAVVRDLDRREWPVARIDARMLAATPDAVLAAIGRAGGGNPGPAAGREWIAAPGPRAVVLDHLEHIPELEPWLLQELIPAAGAGTRFLFATRGMQADAWQQDAGIRDLSTTVHLRQFDAGEVADFLAVHGIDADLADGAHRLSRGNPLVLTLLLPHLHEGGLDEELPAQVLRELMRRLTGGALDPRARTTVEVASLARAVNEDLLAAVLDDGSDAGEAFDWLARQPYVAPSEHGLVLHDLLREILDRELRMRRPERYGELVHRIRGHYMERLLHPGPFGRTRHLQDLAYLMRESPAVRVACGAIGHQRLYFDVPRPGEAAEVAAAIEHHEGPENAAIARYWLDRPNSTLSLLRRPDGRWQGFTLYVRFVGAEPSAEELAADPGIAALWDYITEWGGLREGETAIASRFWLDRDTGRAMGPTQATLFLGTSEQNFSTPRLAFLSGCERADHPGLAAVEAFLASFHGRFTVDGTDYVWAGANWRETKMEAWLDTLGQGSLAIAPDAGLVETDFDAVYALPKEEFGDEVKDALRNWRQPDRLHQSPLLQSRLVVDETGVYSELEQRVAVLRDLLQRTAAELRGPEPGDRHAEILRRTYFDPEARKQAALADELNMGYSTFRLHLQKAIERVTEVLWQMDLGR